MSRTGATLLRGGVARVVHSILSIAVGFWMLPFLISHLGEHSYGLWMAIGSVTANYFLLDVGLASAVTRNVAGALASNDSRTANRVISTALGIYTLIAAIVVVITIILTAFVPLMLAHDHEAVDVRHALLLTGLTLAFHFPFNAFSGIVQARARYDLLTLAQVVTLVVQTAATVMAVRAGYGIVALAYIGLGCAVLSNMLYVIVARHLFAEMSIRRDLMDRVTAKGLFGYSVWSFVAQLADQTRNGINPLVVGWLQNAAAITHFSVGSRLVDYALQLLYRATNLTTPVLTSLLAQGRKDDAQAAVTLIFRINLTLAIFSAGMFVALVHPFLDRWMGPGYDLSASVAIILILAKAVEFSLSPLDSLLYAAAKHKYLSLLLLVDGVFNVGLSLALGARYGLIGVALGTAIPMIFFRGIVAVPMTARLTGMAIAPIGRAVLRSFAVGGVLMLVIGLLIHEGQLPPNYLVIILVSLGAAVLYFPLMFRLAYGPDERRLLVSAAMRALGRK
jgi:O-antigen/teichoic acid export membrane protein